MRTFVRILLACIALAATALLGLAPASDAAGTDAFTATKTVSRVVDGRTTANDVTVRVDHTLNLRGRERLQISWSGAVGTSAQATNPYGATGLTQEYPMVIMECRGAPATVRPETCYTSSIAQRSAGTFDDDSAIWRRDPAWAGGTAPTDPCGTPDNYTVPFIAANGTKFDYCTDEHIAPESLLPAELLGYTAKDGTGAASFEVRTDVENESLGCSHTTACSLVVVPIMGTSCDARHGDDLQFAYCSANRTYPAGTAYGEFEGTPAVKGNYWWTASQWKNRITVPLTFALPANTCDLLDKRPPVGFYGSELLAQASLQWSPAYCLDEKRFKYQHNQMGDASGFDLMLHDQAAGALVSSAHDAGAEHVGYAPTAVTGFGIGYVIDRPAYDENGNPQVGGEIHTLKLDARLLAKLLTQSYTGNAVGAQHPGIEDNPVSINADPEFQKLNPDAPRVGRIEGATLLSLSEASDTVAQLTDYIAHDKDAMAFIAGAKDPYGMVVNPSYKGYRVPTSTWELKDSFVGNTDCWKANPSPFFSLMAAPVSRMYAITQALIDAQPNIQTRCEEQVNAATKWKLGKIDRQGYGNRFMLGLVSLGDAERYGIDVARLETTDGTFVGPDRASESAAVSLMKQKAPQQPFTLDQAAVKRSGTAYPGTMVVYTAAKTCDLKVDVAHDVASFVRIATTEGQVPGSGNGRLPDGFLPIAKTGATAPLFKAAQVTASAVEAQKCGNRAAAVPAAGTSTPAAAAPAAAAPPASATADKAAAVAPTATTPVSMGTTKAPSAAVGFVLLPVLFALALAGALASLVARFLVASRA
ncbi:hypothetical protein [Nocardioides jiangxiensis]|uniref:Uncharacterized protein n=1 Tax=Nocardioides jiangxiensis TaxID=3064524 RepID=A0ABT9B3A6_9ACTN|nr:hypothetical protein [Nocardioides sp. WY-20]MDO7868799.1 hypothetical protein [Nocardioides sp. WY-20]